MRARTSIVASARRRRASCGAAVGASAETGAALTSIYWGSLTLGRLLTAVATARPSWARALTPERLIGGSLAVTMASLLLLATVGAEEIAVCFVATVGVGLSLSSMYPSAITMAQGKFAATGWQTSVFVGGAPLGGIMWPSIVGALMRVFSALAMPWTTLALAGLAALSFCGVLAVGRSAKGSKTDPDDGGGGADARRRSESSLKSSPEETSPEKLRAVFGCSQVL